jgi:hypothetical protein
LDLIYEAHLMVDDKMDMAIAPSIYFNTKLDEPTKQMDIWRDDAFMVLLTNGSLSSN